MCIQLYLSVHIFQNKCTLQSKCKYKYDPKMHAHSLKCVHYNQNTNVFSQIHISSKMCALQLKYKCKYDP